MERRRIRFRGSVQGVGFRATARGMASGHRVTGWVRNEPDGSVLMEVQGERAEIEAFMEALRRRMGRLIRDEDSTPVAVDAIEERFSVRA